MEICHIFFIRGFIDSENKFHDLLGIQILGFFPAGNFFSQFPLIFLIFPCQCIYGQCNLLKIKIQLKSCKFKIITLIHDFGCCQRGLDKYILLINADSPS